ncbi:MAG: hypothetical protein ABI647_14140 [Gemmatimonadota bacterium]
MRIDKNRPSRQAPQHWYLGLAAVFLLKSCAGVTPIKTLLDDPSRFDGKTVRIAGEVQNSAGVLGMGAYQIKDESGTLAVVSEAGGVPRSGAKVGVEGVFHTAFTLGSQTGAVLMEKRRYTP